MRKELKELRDVANSLEHRELEAVGLIVKDKEGNEYVIEFEGKSDE